MKMLCVVYDSYFDDRVTDALKQAGVAAYMKFHDTTGEDAISKALPGALRSPGKDKLIALFTPMSDEEISSLLEIVRELKAKYPIVALRAFTFPLEELI